MIKFFLIFIILIFILFIVAFLFLTSYIVLNKKELKSKEIIIKGNQNKKALILYQKSRHKTATNITMAIAKYLNEKRYSVTINHPSTNNNYNIEKYDIIFLGSAVYMGTVSQPLTRFIERNSFDNKKIIIYLVGSATNINTEIEFLKNKIKKAKSIIGIKIKKGEENKIKELLNNF